MFSNWRNVTGRILVEIAVIVLGVSIALWADSWVAARSDRVTETARLVALGENLVVALADLRAAREDASGAIDALGKLASPDAAGISGEELDNLLRYGLLYGPDAFHPELNVYEDLKNSGDLALLSDPEIRRLLAVMAARLELVQAAQSDMVSVQQINVDPYLISNFALGSLLGPLTGLEVGATVPAADPEILVDREFQNLVVFKLDLVRQLDLQFEAAESALTAVQDSISAWLESR